jgi:solute carrier family 5 (sodium-coupled monocarboxylate transporter), member 8/12
VGSATALSVMTWICFAAQRAIVNGELTFPMKAVSTSGCTYLFADDAASSTSNQTTPTNPPDVHDAGFQIHHISYLWYTLVGSAVCIVVSLIASYATGPNRPSEMNPNLLALFVRKLIKPRSSEAATNNGANVIEISFQLRAKGGGRGGSVESF